MANFALLFIAAKSYAQQQSTQAISEPVTWRLKKKKSPSTLCLLLPPIIKSLELLNHSLCSNGIAVFQKAQRASRHTNVQIALSSETGERIHFNTCICPGSLSQPHFPHTHSYLVVKVKKIGVFFTDICLCIGNQLSNIPAEQSKSKGTERLKRGPWDLTKGPCSSVLCFWQWPAESPQNRMWRWDAGFFRPITSAADRTVEWIQTWDLGGRVPFSLPSLVLMQTANHHCLARSSSTRPETS